MQKSKIKNKKFYNSLFIIHYSNKSGGFTLIEMIVSVGVFSMAILAILSSLLFMIDAQKKAVTIQTAEDNLRFAIDTISKEIRTGSDYMVSPDKTILFFKSGKGEDIIYSVSLDSQSIIKSTNAGPYYPVTSFDVKVNKLTFYLRGEGSGDNRQPRITLIIDASVGGVEKTKSNFNVQTTVTQRRLDS